MTIKTQVSISAFFPALNEEDNIKRLTRALLEVLSSLSERYEVIIVDDGSTDNTGKIADELARLDGQVRVIHHFQSKGYGAALRAGFRAAKCDLIFYTDGDNQFDVSQIKELFPLMNNADIVVGYRVNRQDGYLRIFVSKGYNLMVRMLFGVKIRDIDCSFKLFKKSFIDKIEIESDGYFIDTEMMVKAQRLGLKIKEVGVKHLPRTSGHSKVRLKHVFLTLYEIARLWRRLKGWNFLRIP